MRKLNLSKTFLILLALVCFTNVTTAQIRLITIGDSTMCEHDEERHSGKNEERGWVELLPIYLEKDVEVKNFAKSGRSSKSFHAEFWHQVKDSVQQGDYVLIQFGHNDEKLKGEDSEGYGPKVRGTAAWGQYQEYLTKYVDDVRAKGAHPILLTSVVRGTMDEEGKLIPESLHNLSHICGNDSTMNYPMAMRALAQKLDVPLVDMTKLTQKLVEDYGFEKAKKYIYCNKDNTHLKIAGAGLFSQLAAEEMIRQNMIPNAFNDLLKK